GRVHVRLGYGHGEDRVLPVDFAGDTTRVAAAEGLPAPDYVFANDGDHGYGIFLPDARSAAALERRVHALDDDLLRAMAWGALWHLVGEGRMDPARFVERAVEALPRERDEQIAEAVLSRSLFALQHHLRPAGRARLQPEVERLLLVRMDDPALP